MKSKIPLLPGLLLLMILRAPNQPLAAPVTFTIDPARSSISLSGDFVVPQVATYPFEPQGAGSLTTSYGGKILVELAPPSIWFPGGSAVQANTNGTWQPGVGGVAGNAPADYGGMVAPPLTTGYAAARNLQFDLTSRATLVTNGAFDAGPLVVTYLTNSGPVPAIDFRVSSLISSDNTNGTAPLAGSTTNSPSTARLTNSTGLLTLVLPVNTTNVSSLGGDQATLVLKGQLVATAPAGVWPLLVSVRVQAGQVLLTWPSLPGQSFAVQTKQDLVLGWGPASGVMTVYSNLTSWTGNAASSVGFYRVVGSY